MNTNQSNPTGDANQKEFKSEDSLSFVKKESTPEQVLEQKESIPEQVLEQKKSIPEQVLEQKESIPEQPKEEVNPNFEAIKNIVAKQESKKDLSETNKEPEAEKPVVSDESKFEDIGEEKPKVVLEQPNNDLPSKNSQEESQVSSNDVSKPVITNLEIKEKNGKWQKYLNPRYLKLAGFAVVSLLVILIVNFYFLTSTKDVASNLLNSNNTTTEKKDFSKFEKKFMESKTINLSINNSKSFAIPFSNPKELTIKSIKSSGVLLDQGIFNINILDLVDNKFDNNLIKFKEDVKLNEVYSNFQLVDNKIVMEIKYDEVKKIERIEIIISMETDKIEDLKKNIEISDKKLIETDKIDNSKEIENTKVSDKTSMKTDKVNDSKETIEDSNKNLMNLRKRPVKNNNSVTSNNNQTKEEESSSLQSKEKIDNNKENENIINDNVNETSKTTLRSVPNPQKKTIWISIY